MTGSIIGRLTRDPEVRFAATGTAVASFSVATNHRYQDRAGQWKDEAAFVSSVCFGRMAEKLTGKRKGDPVLVVGRLRTESWVKDGVNHSRLVLVAEAINFIAPDPTPKDTTCSGELPVPSGEVRNAIPF